MKNKAIVLYLAVIALLLVAVLTWYAYSYLSQPKPESINFDGPRAYGGIPTQFALGSRLEQRHTPDKVSAASLPAAGETFRMWVIQQQSG